VGKKNRKQAGRDKTAEILGSKERVNILAVGSQREITPSEYEAEEGIKEGGSGYHFKVLYEAGYLEIVREEQAGGARRIFYRTRQSNYVANDDFEVMDSKQRRHFSFSAIKAMFRRAMKALWTGTLDKRTNSQLAWNAGHLDEQAFDEGMQVLSEAFDRIEELSDEAAVRLEGSGAKSVYATWGVMGFESPLERRPPGGLGNRFRARRRPA
jgi:DNA-binding transcriptional ArsR family regulator